MQYRAGASGCQPDLERFWGQAMVQLASWPAQPQWRDDTLTFAGIAMEPCQVRVHLEPSSALPPVLYLLDRDAPDAFAGGSTHCWAALDVREMWDDVASGPEPSRHPMYHAFLVAQRTMLLLMSHPDVRQRRMGIVGEGRGGAVALALAALLRHQAAFVAAHQPVEPVAAAGNALSQPQNAASLTMLQGYFALATFASSVRCPTLISWGGKDSVAPSENVISVYDRLVCDKTAVELPWASHCQADDLREFSEAWRGWTREKLTGVDRPVQATGCGDGTQTSMHAIPAVGSSTSP